MMRRVYVGIMALLLVSGILQFYFAAIGSFARPQTEDAFSLHVINGRMVFPALAILALIAAALAKAPGKLIALTLAPLGLLIVQSLIIVLGNVIGGSTEQRTTPVSLAILGLHALNGAAVIAATEAVFRRAREHAAAARTVTPALDAVK